MGTAFARAANDRATRGRGQCVANPIDDSRRFEAERAVKRHQDRDAWSAEPEAGRKRLARGAIGMDDVNFPLVAKLRELSDRRPFEYRLALKHQKSVKHRGSLPFVTTQM